MVLVSMRCWCRSVRRIVGTKRWPGGERMQRRGTGHSRHGTHAARRRTAAPRCRRRPARPAGVQLRIIHSGPSAQGRPAGGAWRRRRRCGALVRSRPAGLLLEGRDLLGRRQVGAHLVDGGPAAAGGASEAAAAGPANVASTCSRDLPWPTFTPFPTLHQKESACPIASG